MYNIAIIKRSGITSGTLTTFIILILLGIGGLSYGIIDVAVVHFLKNIAALICFFAASGIIVLYIGNLLIQSARNKKNVIPPVVYDSTKKKVILTTIGGKGYEVDISKIVKVGGLSTFDNRLFITIQDCGKEKKLNLGFVDKNIDLKSEFNKIEKL